MDALIWIMLPAITAMGSALLAFYIMQARLEVVVAKEREALVEARAMMKNHERQLEDRVKMTEEETKRRSFDEFLGDIRPAATLLVVSGLYKPEMKVEIEVTAKRRST